AFEVSVIIALALFVSAACGLVIAGQYLRNQRERMDLVTSSEKLTKGFQNMRHRVGSGGLWIAGQEFSLTPFERITYRALMVSADVALACVVLLLPFEVLTGGPGGILGNPIGINDPVGDLLPFEQLSGIGLFIGILEIILAAILFTALFSGMVSL